MGFNAMNFPQYPWVAASLVLVIPMSIHGVAIYCPFASLRNRYFIAVAL